MKRSFSFTPEELEELRRIDEQIDAEFETGQITLQEHSEAERRDKEALQDRLDNRQKKESAYRKAYREANREKDAAYRKAYYAANREKLLLRKKQWDAANRGKKADYMKIYRHTNKGRLSAQEKAYREQHRAERAEKRRAYDAANKDKIAAQKKAWHAAHKAENAARSREYYHSHKERYDLRRKAYQEANKEAISARRKAYREANKEKIAQYKKAYSASHREKIAADKKAYNERRKMGISTIKTNSHEEWLALRKKYIGGSDAAAVVNMNAFSSPFALWAEKTGKVPGFEGNLATEVGAFLEEFIAKKFAAETGKQVRRRRVSFVNSNYPWAIANIDRDIVGEDAGLEIKFTDTLNTKKFKNGEYPDNFYVQCVHYLAVTGKKRWYLAVLVGNREFHIYTIERDEDEIRALMAAEEAFWNNYVLKDTPPPTDGTKATTETISGLYAEAENDNIIDLCSVREALDEYMEITRQIKALDKIKEAKANEIKALMGNSSKGTGGNYKVSWNNASRSTFDAKRFAEENPTIDLRPYYKLSSYRTFKVTEAGR